MGSVFIPIDDTTRENGCLQVLTASHHMGRITHGLSGEQRAADMERVEQAKHKLDHLYLEMKAGDILFFHCNLLHGSDPNTSDKRRWVFVVAFNKKKNDPYKEHHMPRYTPMIKMPDSALMECDADEEVANTNFMKLSEDHYLRANTI
ncbi:hypothetical protein SK128_006744 [Halocaridina rubra]|uniref:Phytanoyl-CoA dioxygenase n=1 Tax=Halocaridina rubra TaxID=373956 RepID=A0AAN8WTH5_HALRR